MPAIAISSVPPAKFTPSIATSSFLLLLNCQAHTNQGPKTRSSAKPLKPHGLVSHANWNSANSPSNCLSLRMNHDQKILTDEYNTRKRCEGPGNEHRNHHKSAEWDLRRIHLNERIHEARQNEYRKNKRNEDEAGQKQISRVDCGQCPRVCAQETNFGTQIVAVPPQCLDRFQLGLGRLVGDGLGQFRNRLDCLSQGASVYPCGKPRSDESSTRYGRKIVKAAEQTTLRKPLENPEIESCAADTASR